MLPPGAPEPCSDLTLSVDVLSTLRLCPAPRLIRLPAPVPAPDASSREPVRVGLLLASAVIEPPSPSRVALTLRLLPVKVRSWPALTSTSPRPTASLPSIVSLIITSRCAARVATPLPPPTPVTSRLCVRVSAWADSMSIVPPACGPAGEAAGAVRAHRTRDRERAVRGRVRGEVHLAAVVAGGAIGHEPLPPLH